MKRMTQSVMMAAVLAAVAGIAQAGRGIDNPVPAHKDAAVERAAADASVTYTGRPNDTIAVAPARSEGDAEFAVMDVQGGGAGGMGAYHGRPMDNPAR